MNDLNLTWNHSSIWTKKKHFSCKITIRQQKKWTFGAIPIRCHWRLHWFVSLIMGAFLSLCILFESSYIFVEHLNIFQFSIWNGKNASNVDSFGFFFQFSYFIHIFKFQNPKQLHLLFILHVFGNIVSMRKNFDWFFFSLIKRNILWRIDLITPKFGAITNQ